MAASKKLCIITAAFCLGLLVEATHGAPAERSADGYNMFAHYSVFSTYIAIFFSNVAFPGLE